MDGIRFDSRAELDRYLELKMLARSGAVANIELQPEYVLLDRFVHPEHGKLGPLRYRADFRYQETATGKTIVEDVKGHRTDVYRIKRILLLWRYPEIEFREITR
jgi:hypothetical protein